MYHVGFPTIDNIVSHSLCVLTGQMQREAKKVVGKLSKSCQKLIKKLCQLATVRSP